MTEQADLNSHRWQIDFPLGWMAARAMQAFFLIAFLKFAYLAAESEDILDLVSNLIMICFVFAYCHRFSTGEIDQDGIRFRRYFVERHFCWQDVHEIRWRGSCLIFVLKRGNFLSRRLDFILNPATSAIPYWRHGHGLDTPLLPILERIHALTGDTPQIVSVPAQSRWIMRAFIGLTLLLVAVMLMRLLTHF
jgi:hypothetical protein